MSITTSYSFDDLANFILSDSSKITIAAGKALLKIISSLGDTFNQPFTSSTGFTFDSAKAEFPGSLVRQIDKTPSGSTSHATYTNDINLNWGDGVLTGTGVGSPAVSGGKLDLTGGGLKYVTYDAVGNAGFTQTGCIRWKYTPGYSGTPVVTYPIMTTSKDKNDRDNRIMVYHAPSTGDVVWEVRDSGDNILFSTTAISGWNPTAGVEYEWELNIDINAGNSEIYLDGTRQGAAETATGTRDTTGKVFIGTNWTETNFNDASYNDIMFFDSVQHSGASYTPAAYAVEVAFLGSLVTLPVLTYPGIGAIQAFTGFTTTEANSPRYIIGGMYWSGSAWVASDDSYAQANSQADVNTNISAFTAADSVIIKVVFDDVSDLSSSMNVDDLTLTYTGQTYPTDDPTLKPATTFNAEDLISFTEVVTETGSDTVTYTIEANGVEMWWSGAAWVTSNGTVAESNSASDINTNASALISTGSTLRPVIYLHSDDGTTTPDIDTLTLVSDFFAGTPDPPSKTIVFGDILDAQGGVENVVVQAVLEQVAVYKSRIQLPVKVAQTTTNADGYWELELVETDNIENNPTYLFDFQHAVYAAKFKKNIPDQVSVAFASISGGPIAEEDL